MKAKKAKPVVVDTPEFRSERVRPVARHRYRAGSQAG
jgi:hypothetical protein